MNFQERFLYSMRNLAHRKLRTALTILGIIVGIASIIILISLAGGLKEDVVSRLANFDPDLILILPTQVTPGDLSSVVRQGKLYDKDYNSIRQIPGVGVMSKTISKRVALEFKDELISATVYAIEPSIYTETTTLTLQTGRFLQEGDRDVVVFGGGIAELFDKDVQNFANLDNIVYMEYNEGRRIFSDFILPNEISAMQVKVLEGYDVVEVSDRIEEVLLRNHKVSEDEKDFGILTAVSLNEQVNSIIEVISVFLGAVAAISILVGMIGISNTMFMSVMERTKEVGVLKAIGASRKKIINIFIIEAGILGLLGGILGLLVALIFNFILSLFGVTTAMGIELLLGSVIFAFVIGVIAGVFPAKNASEIPAIEALRYE